MAGAVAEEATCAPCTGDDGSGQGRPRSPCPYKYYPNAGKERRKGGETAEKGEGDRERERQKQKKQGRTEEEEERKKKEEREAGRRDRREEGRTQDRRRKPAGGEDTDWCLYTAEKKRRRCH
jgi:hypothetical protein